MDNFWKSALCASLDTLPFVDVFYSPERFFNYSRKFYPLEFSIVRSSNKVGFCVQKDLLHRIDCSLLEMVTEPRQVIFSNEVFIVVCLDAPTGIDWFYGQEQRYSEFCLLRESVIADSYGKNITPYWRVDKSFGEKKVLIVGATNMGNIGDDLLAAAIGANIRELDFNCSLYFSDFRVSKADLKCFDMIIVGGGGIIYSSQFGLNDTTNLSNYLKIPIWAAEFSIPCFLIGVGVQGRPGHLGRDPTVRNFLIKALCNTSTIAVRDSLSKSELEGLTGLDIVKLPDLMFAFGRQFSFFESRADRGSAKAVAFIGEIFASRISFFNRVLTQDISQFWQIFAGADLRYFVMSNDDIPHRDRFVHLAESAGLKCIVHDLRGLNIVEVLSVFRGMSAVVSTRFHGVIFSFLAGVPVISIDLSFGKHALLINDYINSAKDNLIDENCMLDDIYYKLDKLRNSPLEFLPDISELKSVIELTSSYLDILKTGLDDINSDEQKNQFE